MKFWRADCNESSVELLSATTTSAYAGRLLISGNKNVSKKRFPFQFRITTASLTIFMQLNYKNTLFFNINKQRFYHTKQTQLF